MLISRSISDIRVFAFWLDFSGFGLFGLPRGRCLDSEANMHIESRLPRGNIFELCTSLYPSDPNSQPWQPQPITLRSLHINMDFTHHNGLDIVNDTYLSGYHYGNVLLLLVLSARY
jgi:hypothetical protein